MKNRSVSLCLVTATLFAAPAFAADSPAEGVNPPPVPDQKSRPTREDVLKRFDQDGDGKLNDAERQAAREERRGQWAEKRGPMREKMLKRFDKDGDGKLNEAERKEAGKAAKKMRHHRHQRMMKSPGKPAHHRMKEATGPRGPMRQALLKRFDQDGDGRLNDSEKAEARKAGEDRRAKAKAHRQEVLSRFDADGDGKLDDTERQAMRDAWQKFLSQQPPV